MPKFTLSEAAKLVGINRRTIYKHISKGKVSATLDDMGNKCIDAAELHRAYGDFDLKGTTGHNQESLLIAPEGTAWAKAVIEELKGLRQDNKKLAEELAAIRKELSERPLLEHKPVQTITTPPNTPAQDESHHHPYGDIMKRLKASRVKKEKN